MILKWSCGFKDIAGLGGLGNNITKNWKWIEWIFVRLNNNTREYTKEHNRTFAEQSDGSDRKRIKDGTKEYIW